MSEVLDSVSPVVVSKSVEECPIVHVTVYRNQAEVHRVVKLTSEEVGAGHHDVVVSGLAHEVDSNTLRVKGLGAFEILEVTLEAKYPEQEEKTQENELKGEIKELQAQIKASRQVETTLTKAKEHTESYLENFVASAAQAPNHSSGALDPAAVGVDKMLQVMEFYRTQQTQLDENIIQEQERREKLQEHLNSLHRKLSDIVRPGGASGPQARNDATISINVAQPNTYIEMTLSYILPNASWAPSYDMRLGSSDQSMTLTYYGQVTQRTGESWNGCSLSLSTAEPAIQGFPPALQSKTVSIAQPEIWHGAGSNMKSFSSSMPVSRSASALGGGGAPLAPPLPPGAIAFAAAAAAPPPMPVAAQTISTTVAKQDAVGASLFEIPRKVYIDSDGKSHKVTIANLQMEARLTHFAVPAVSSHAYIQAKASNPSDYSLLKSPMMSVYLDGSFITKTELPDNVSPGESFTTFVGVDPTVKLEYRPVKTRERSSGWMSKTVTMSYEYATIVKNTKSTEINIFINDSVPRCEVEKVTVELSAPAAADLTPLATALGAEQDTPSLTDKQLIQQLIERGISSITVQNTVTNNLVWARSVAAGGMITLPMHYSVARPAELLVDVNTRN